MYNPFGEHPEESESDLEMIRQVLEGDRSALERLISRHQAWIYNIAFKMTADINDAEDVTQEILIKIMTKLSTYDSMKASFRTWLYRITANHVINMNRRKNETLRFTLEDLESIVGARQNKDKWNHAPGPEFNALLNESRSICVNGILMCLGRKQRLVFILGDIFGVSGVVGAEIMEMTQANFRKILSRSRERVYNFFNDKCGLVDPKNPCRCSHFFKVADDRGWLNHATLKRKKEHYGTISALTGEGFDRLDRSLAEMSKKLYRSEPFLMPPDQTVWIRKVLDSNEFKNLFLV